MNWNDKLAAKLAGYGLALRGTFAPVPADHTPAIDEYNGPTSLTLIGNVGSSIWPYFSASEEYRDNNPHPLDRWSKRVGDQLASEFGGLALYPFDGPPYWPFLSWTQKAENLTASPLGLSFHPEYGLWHAYRFALLLPYQKVCSADNTQRPPAQNSFDCSVCKDQPCLQSCPVEAFSGQSYNTGKCLTHLNSDPIAHCNTHGCLARHACPVGQEFAYTPAQASFHMRAFKLAAR